jgi:hypothetical protein
MHLVKKLVQNFCRNVINTVSENKWDMESRTVLEQKNVSLNVTPYRSDDTYVSTKLHGITLKKT